MLSNVIIAVYVLAWFITYRVYIKKNPKYGVGGFLILEYLLFAVLSLILYNLPSHRNEWTAITLFPFIYLYCMLLIASVPVLQFNNDRIRSISPPNKTVFNVFLYTFIVCSLFQIPSIISELGEGLTLIVLDPDNAADIYNERAQDSLTTTHNRIDGIITAPFTIFANIFGNFCVFLFFYYQTLKKKKKTISLLLLFIILVSILRSVSQANRTGVVLTLIMFVAAYALFYGFIEKTQRKTINITGVVFASIIAVFMAIITISRFSDSEGGPLDSVINYAGQENLNFNEYCMDAGGTREGERTCNTFKQMLGFEGVAPDVRSVREKYGNLKFSDQYFSTFVGDYVLDFGPYITAILFIVFSIIFTKLTKVRHSQISFHQLILVYFALEVCAKGAMYLHVFSFSDNYKIIAVIIAYLLFKFTDPKYIDIIFLWNHE